MPTQGVGSPGRGQSPAPQAELGPSVAACLSPLGIRLCPDPEGTKLLYGWHGKATANPELIEEPSCLTPHVPTQPRDVAEPPQSQCCLQQHLLSHRISQGPETRPARPAALAVRNAQQPVGSQALQQHHSSVHALTSPKAALSLLGILLGLKGGG